MHKRKDCLRQGDFVPSTSSELSLLKQGLNTPLLFVAEDCCFEEGCVYPGHLLECHICVFSLTARIWKLGVIAAAPDQAFQRDESLFELILLKGEFQTKREAQVQPPTL